MSMILLRLSAGFKIKKDMLKKIAFTVATVALIATVFSSCKSHERCPAYGKVKTNSESRI